jgi:minor extracellular protease Epr
MGKMKKFLLISIPLLIIIFFHPIKIVQGEEQKVEKLILFKDYVDKTLIKHLNGTILEEYKNIPAIRISIPEENLYRLSQDISIKSIESEQHIKVDGQIQDWGVSSIQAPNAWHSNYTGKNVKVAVIDSGIFPHNDLTIAGGKSFVSYTNSYNDDNGHGTHIAGVIAAKNNDIGVVGVAPDSKLFAVKVLNNKGVGLLSDVLSGIDWAITNKMDIINLSLGSMDHSSILQETINRASNSGILVVAAAGNDGNSNGIGDNVSYPARYDSVIAVAATDSQNKRASFSSTGGAVDFASPGVNILSTFLNNQYVTYSGTSMAAPFVTGDLALLKEMYPTMPNKDLVEQLKKRAVDLGTRGWDPLYGNGLIQATKSPERITGADRFEVAVNVSKKGWQNSNTVFIANYMAFADALSASPLAYKYNAPILLTTAGNLNPSTKQEIIRLGAKEVIIIGGIGSVNESVKNEIRAIGKNTRRIDGSNRFEVSKNIANEMGTFQTAIVANGLNFPDALAISPYASVNGFPILLTKPDDLPHEIGVVLFQKKISNTVIVGGEASVSRNVYSKLPTPIRIGGKDRYEVAKNILDKYYPNPSKLFLATGSTFADALTGSVLVSKDKTALLLTTKDQLPNSTSIALSNRTIQDYTILGGVGSVGNTIFSLLTK